MSKNNDLSRKTEKAFTLIETLLAFTILVMVFNIFYFYMQSQNRQIMTIVQKNEVEELANLVMQYLSNDIKSAKRGTVVITPSSLTLDRFIEEEKDTKKSAQLALMKVDYLYDQSKQQLVRNASMYDPGSYDGASDTFKSAPKLSETKTFNRVSSFEMAKIPMPPIVGISDIGKHMLGVEAKVSSEAPNVLTHVSQKSFKEDQVYIRDEVAFKNQPFWNQNPKYTKVGPLSLKFTDPLTINLSQTELIGWINSLKKASNVRLVFEDINNQIMNGLSKAALAKVNPLYNNFMSRIEGEVKNKAKDLFIDKAAQEYAGKKENIVTAMLLKDYILSRNSSDCQALKNRIITGALDDSEIKALVKNNAEKLKKYGVLSAADISAIDDATSSVQIISKVSNLIYSSKAEMPHLVFKFVESLSLAFANDVKKQLCDAIDVNGYVQKKIGEAIDPAIDGLLSILGVKAIIDEFDKEGEIGEIAKIAIRSAVNSFKSWLKDQINQKLGEFTKTLLDTVKNSVTQNASSGKTKEDIIKEQQQKSIGDDIGGAVNDMFSAVIIVISKNLLLGNKFDEANQAFVNSGAKDYLSSAFKDFSYNISSVLDKNEQEAIKNDEQVRRIEKIMTK